MLSFLIFSLFLNNVFPYVDSLKTGGQKSIVGGKAAADDHPHTHQISLRCHNRHTCGGSIITDRKILTAAHCVDGACIKNMLHIVVGIAKLRSLKQKKYFLKHIHSHPFYNNVTLHNDICVLITDTKIVFGLRVQPIPIYVGKLEGGRICTVSGWGLLKAKGNIPNDLQELNTTTLTGKDCIMRQPTRKSIITDEKQICAYSSYGRGLCSGDSGGPLVYKGKLVGIVSWGRGCACGYPDVFTRVNYYINWINSLHC